MYACTLLGGLSIPGPAAAAPYPVEIHVDDEADIDQLYFDGEIDAEMRERLLSLLRAKLDLNVASRDELYELPGFTYALADAVVAARQKRRFQSTSELATVEGMTPAVYDQAQAFVTVKAEAELAKTYEGEIQVGGTGRTHNDDPAFYLRGRSRFFNHAGFGLLVAARPMIGGVNDAVQGWMCKTSECLQGAALTAAPEAIRFDPAAFYAYWDGPRLAAIGGSYRVGFGLGVTMDNSRRQLPHGWYPNTDFTEDYDAGKLTPYDGLMGLAVRYKQLDLGRGWLDLSAFGSYWNRDLYFTEIYYDRCQGDKCLPTICDETPVFNAVRNRYEYPSLYCDYPTLPWIMRELLGGANATYRFNRRSSVGVTGYASNWKMRAEAPSIRPANSSRFPNDRSTYGAVGVNSTVGFSRYDLAAEVALTDRGAPGLLAKAFLEPAPDVELIPSFRYYSPDYKNPYARGEADGDEYLGNRARDELGGRITVAYRPWERLRLRADLDVWHHRFPALRCDPRVDDPEHPLYCNPDTMIDPDPRPATDLEALLQAQLSPTSRERLVVWASYHDEDLERSGHKWSYQPYFSKTQGDLSGGAKVSWALGATTSRIPRVGVSLMFKQTFEDSYRFADRFDHSYYVWLRVSASLVPGPTVVARVKYSDESTTADPDRKHYPDGTPRAGFLSRCDSEVGLTNDQLADELPGSCRGESYVDAYLQLTQRIPLALIAGSLVKVQVGWTRFTDHREKWTAGSPPCDPDPVRDEFLVRGHLMVRF